MTDTGFTAPPGVVCMTTHGTVVAESAAAWGEMRAFCVQNGLVNVAWHFVHGALVDKARNEAVTSFLQQTEAFAAKSPDPASSPWLLFIDADMRWEPNALLKLLHTAYVTQPTAAIVGAWCPLRGYPYLPTIDPGSGTWEPVEPSTGPVDVMRTGGAFILIKRHVFTKMRPPWYSVRAAETALDVLQELDTFALTKFDGRNPLREHPAWAILERVAAAESNGQRPAYPWGHVGEDSNFCDRARALGFRIVVDTDVVIQHMDRKLIGPKEHMDAMREVRQAEARASGVLTSR